MTDQEVSWEAYAQATDDARFTAWLREQSEPAWTAAVDHPFINELGAGALPEDAFAAYLVQDYAFLDALVGAFGYAVGDAPDIPTKRPLVEFLDTVTDEENDYFQRAFDVLDVPDHDRHTPSLTPTTEAFLDLLGRASREGGYAETLSVLVPAEWIYAEWATTLADRHGDPNQDPPSAGADLPFYYGEWIDLHATPAFVAFVDWLRGQLDTAGPAVSPRRRTRVARHFTRTVELEAAFFDAAYGGHP